MKPKHKRLITLLLVVIVMGGAAAGILSSFREQLIFFYTPTDLHQALASTQPFDRTREIRVGGIIKEGTVYRTQAGKTGFVITDLTNEIHAFTMGPVPALFREGQGVVAQGHFDQTGVLNATTILAKHDENYMPKEVVDALKKSGRWQEGEGRAITPAPAPDGNFSSGVEGEEVEGGVE